MKEMNSSNSKILLTLAKVIETNKRFPFMHKIFIISIRKFFQRIIILIRILKITMEKIAYIILAHKDPVHLKRLISVLNFHSDFYIHIDRKVDPRPFLKELSSLNIVVYSISKYAVTWGGYSLVLAQKEMLGAILNSGEKYKRIVCISGLDYPIYSNQMIHEIFDKNPKKEFIAGLNISHEEPKEIRRIINYFFVDYPFLIGNKIIAKSLRKLSPFIKLNLKKSNVSYLNKKKADVYFGSTWFAITYICAQNVYNSLCQEKRFLRYISTAYAPDELCINTIVFNSKFGKNAIRMPKNFALSIPGEIAFEKLSPLHYLNYKEKMYTLTECDYEKIVLSNKMFFRKAETGISDILLDKIDRMREQ